MSRYIDDEISHFIETEPTADVQKVRHGEWVETGSKPEAVCSLCGRAVVYKIVNDRWQYENYCPHCGAKMEEKTDNE